MAKCLLNAWMCSVLLACSASHGETGTDAGGCGPCSMRCCTVDHSGRVVAPFCPVGEECGGFPDGGADCGSFMPQCLPIILATSTADWDCCDPSDTPTAPTCTPSGWTCPPGMSAGCVFDGVCTLSDGGVPTPNWASCSHASECVLEHNTCCACGTPTLADVDSVNMDHVLDHTYAVCPMPHSCPFCPIVENPDLIATCSEAHVCQVLDVSMEDLSACSVDSDCELEARTCCACGDIAVGDVVAVNAAHRTEYQARLCSPDDLACPPCVPNFRSNAVALCGSSGHCQAAYTR